MPLRSVTYSQWGDRKKETKVCKTSEMFYSRSFKSQIMVFITPLKIQGILGSFFTSKTLKIVPAWAGLTSKGPNTGKHDWVTVAALQGKRWHICSFSGLREYTESVMCKPVSCFHFVFSGVVKDWGALVKWYEWRQTYVLHAFLGAESYHKTKRMQHWF